MADGVALPTITHTETSVEPVWGDNPTPFNRDSDGYPVGALDGADHTDNQPVDEPATAHSGTAARSFVDDFYNRVLIDPAVIDVGNLVSEQIVTIDVFNGYFVTKTLEGLTATGDDGLSIVGPAPPTDWASLETRSYQLTVGTDGPPTIDAVYSFDWEAGVEDIDVTVSGARIVSLPFPAQAPLTEILAWQTKILTSYDGTEQRVRLRSSPRQTISANYPLNASQVPRAENFVYGWLDRRWAVPLWTEAQAPGALSSGALTINVDTTAVDFREGDLALIWDNDRDNELIEVDTVNAGSIDLVRALGRSYTNPQVAPVRTARAKGSVTRDTNGYDGRLSMSFEVLENIDLAPSAPAQYLGEDIYYDENLMGSTSISDNIEKRRDVVDFGYGTVEFFSPWTHTRIGRPHRYVLEGLDEIWAFREWLHRRAGKLRPYWLPSFENNVRLKMTGLVTGTLTTYADGYRELASARDHLAIQLTDGTWHPRAVTATSEVDAETATIALDAPLNVDASRIARICYLGLKRLNTDRVELRWVGNRVVVSQVGILEIEP